MQRERRTRIKFTNASWGVAAAVTGKGKFTEISQGDGRPMEECSMTTCRERSRSANLRQQVAILGDKLESQLQDWNIYYCSGCGSSFKLLLPKETFSDYPPRHQQWQCVAMATRKSMARESFWLRRCQIQGTEDVDWSRLFCLQRSRSK